DDAGDDCRAGIAKVPAESRQAGIGQARSLRSRPKVRLLGCGHAWSSRLRFLLVGSYAGKGANLLSSCIENLNSHFLRGLFEVVIDRGLVHRADGFPRLI